MWNVFHSYYTLMLYRQSRLALVAFVKCASSSSLRQILHVHLRWLLSLRYQNFSISQMFLFLSKSFYMLRWRFFCGAQFSHKSSIRTGKTFFLTLATFLSNAYTWLNFVEYLFHKLQTTIPRFLNLYVFEWTDHHSFSHIYSYALRLHARYRFYHRIFIFSSLSLVANNTKASAYISSIVTPFLSYV